MCPYSRDNFTKSLKHMSACMYLCLMDQNHICAIHSMECAMLPSLECIRTIQMKDAKTGTYTHTHTHTHKYDTNSGKEYNGKPVLRYCRGRCHVCCMLYSALHKCTQTCVRESQQIEVHAQYESQPGEAFGQDCTHTLTPDYIYIFTI